eukprot:s337_g15.t2
MAFVLPELPMLDINSGTKFHLFQWQVAAWSELTAVQHCGNVQIPSQAWFMQPMFTCAVGGVLPFGAVFTELFFIMSSLWQHQFYYLFGFLALVLVILLITCAEISIALTYFQLTAENYNWWWRSFMASASSAVYVFMYSIMYFSTRLSIDKMVSTLLYFGYMFILSLIFGLLTGSIGLTASFYFVRTIYVFFCWEDAAGKEEGGRWRGRSKCMATRALGTNDGQTGANASKPGPAVGRRTSAAKLASLDWQPPPSPTTTMRPQSVALDLGRAIERGLGGSLGATPAFEQELWEVRAEIEKAKLRHVAPFPFFGKAMRFQDEFAALQITDDGRFSYSFVDLNYEVFESKRVGSMAALLGDLLLGAATFRTHFQQSRFDMESVLEGGVEPCMNGAAGYILTLGVVDAARGHGLAKQLLQKTMDSIRQRLPKLQAIWVHVVEYNAPAISLYEHMGLQMVRHFPRYWDSLLYVLYENGGRPANNLKAQVWRDETLAMLASLSHPQDVHRRCHAWFSCCFTSCARRRRKVDLEGADQPSMEDPKVSRVLTYEGVLISPVEEIPQEEAEPEAEGSARIEGLAMAKHEIEDVGGRAQLVGISRSSSRFAIVVSPYFQPNVAVVYSLHLARSPRRPRRTQLAYVGRGTKRELHSTTMRNGDVWRLTQQRRRAPKPKFSKSGSTSMLPAAAPSRRTKEADGCSSSKLTGVASAPQLPALVDKKDKKEMTSVSDWRDFYKQRAQELLGS